MKHILRYSLLAGALTLAGCVVPVPHKRIHEFGVTGRLLDSMSRTPVKAARIEASEGRTEAALSDANGFFTLKPVYGWHGAYCIGPISLSLWPALDVPSMSRTIMITASGHRSATIRFRGPANVNACIQAGDISIKPE